METVTSAMVLRWAWLCEVPEQPGGWGISVLGDWAWEESTRKQTMEEEFGLIMKEDSIKGQWLIHWFSKASI